ncbi:uncharacterized membrane-anchored protein YitT (DUF2179 family) [Desulfobaculum xiamenense]|uniref:Uncharacterized membrane-anchored protein YitT (DUF2179 family) n=1 Tax=Desulfobaculum xiamenense TaxID=995050 RepID=A0A846QM86_9BACT|nr:YitT family protein [Desulfobaculum xiamenense]NJB68140.1 uncharacterized membrane-anchored protein YitT (DUF2179 family) [Desulfobaculum xiamenense]
MRRDITYSVPWNLGLITIGTALFALAVKSIAVPHGFISGGIAGLGILLYYLTDALTPGIWLCVLNIPVFLIGWFAVSRRFFFYSLYGTVAMVFFVDLIDWKFPVQDPWLAAMAAGTIFGAGLGIAFRSLGSCGGTDIVAVALNQRYNLRIGTVNFSFNLALFACSMYYLDVDRVLYSLATVFIGAQVMEYFLGMFNQRKMALIISDKTEEIAKTVLKDLHRGATYLYGRGAYSGRRKRILLTVVNNIQVKRLEEAVYTIDPQAFTIVESPLNVLGHNFSRRKVY